MEPGDRTVVCEKQTSRRHTSHEFCHGDPRGRFDRRLFGQNRPSHTRATAVHFVFFIVPVRRPSSSKLSDTFHDVSAVHNARSIRGESSTNVPLRYTSVNEKFNKTSHLALCAIFLSRRRERAIRYKTRHTRPRSCRATLIPKTSRHVHKTTL